MEQTLKLTLLTLIIFTFAVIPLSAQTDEKAKKRAVKTLNG